MFEKKISSIDRSTNVDIFIKRPDKYREIEKFSLSSDNLITMGACASYTPASFKKNNLSLLFTKFDRIINFDKANKTITVEAGIKLSNLLNFTLKENLWLPQIPGYPSITLGGAVAANTHGKSSDTHGTIRNQIKSILIFHKTHGWMSLSDKENKNIFDLTIGGFGLTGTIVNVELELIEITGCNFTTTIEKVSSAKDAVEKLNNKDFSNLFSYSWNKTSNIKKFGEGLIFNNKVNENEKNLPIRKMNFKNKSLNKYFTFNLWNKYSIKFFQNLYYNYFTIYKNKTINDNYENVLFPYAGKETYFHMYGKKGFIESQLLVPLNKVDIFLDELEQLINVDEPDIVLFSIKKIIGKELFLRFENTGICFTFDFSKNKKNLNFLEKLDVLSIKHGVKPSIIKDSRLNSNTIKKCYNDFENFRKNLSEFDNKKIYRSELSDRIGI
jgi:decaprenylphospho-beta-D-ribofuranose 2-oxidase